MSIAAMKLALEALENHTAIKHPQQIHYRNEAIMALRTAIEEAEKQEPITWHHPDCEGACIACLIERGVEAQYGPHGLAYLRRHVIDKPNSRENTC